MSSERIPVGIQLYSLRDVIGDDVPGTLKQLAAMGYEGVEFAGTYGLSAPELRGMLDDNGLKCAGAHVGLNLLEGDPLEETVEFYRALGTDRLIVPYADMKELDSLIARMKSAHEKITALGARLSYHNHTQEFQVVDGETCFDKLFGELPADVLVQLDIGWATAAEQDVAAILRRYGKQIETVHVKEFNPEDKTSVVGEGIVDWPTVFDVLEKETAVKWYVVEQEQYKVGSMDSARGCIENIRKMGR